MVSEALDMPVKVPELAKFGYQIAGIRVYAHMNGGNAVELEYRDERNRLFTMYMRRPSGPASVDMTERNGMWTCIWQDDVLGTVMQGEMSAAEMARLASAAYNGLYL
jgi:anti-sigma factor RsiW